MVCVCVCADRAPAAYNLLIQKLQCFIRYEPIKLFFIKKKTFIVGLKFQRTNTSIRSNGIEIARDSNIL